MRRLATIGASTALLALTGAGPALACAALIGPNGSVQVERTTTLAAYHKGVEHYVTSFEFLGGGAEFGAIVPLPGVPTDVVKGGDWTLQRLVREVTPDETALLRDGAEAAPVPAAAEVLQEVAIDALDVTILKGGGDEVGRWAREQGFQLTPDFPEILDFYAARSPIFMAARYDVERAQQSGQLVGTGTPVHLTIPTDNPWVPLRILGAGAAPGDRVEADIFLLTDDRPALLPTPGRGMALERSERASQTLLTDLRTDQGMEWVPDRMWLSYLRLDVPAADLDHDLAVDAWATGRPSQVDAGIAPVLRDVSDAAREATQRSLPAAVPLAVVAAAGLGLAGGAYLAGRVAEGRAGTDRSPGSRG
ncbi:MAG TPA: DUF2330 domain-containing protein [Nitriliruptorales bacterium]|nr:DUF2330 domain-containing protein [Nitriliruptorales bacterium]